MKRIQFIVLIHIILILSLLCSCQENKDLVNSDVDINRPETPESSKIMNSTELDWEWVVSPEEYDDVIFIDDSVIAVQDTDGNYGVINFQKDVVIPFEYKKASAADKSILMIRNDGRILYFDYQGTPFLTLDDEYEDAHNFFEGLAAVKLNGRWGFIDAAGELAIPNQYDQVWNFSGNLAEVRKGDKWGVIDSSGKTISECMYDEMESFQEGCAAVKKDNKWGFINDAGRRTVDCIYDEVRSFQEGYAAVSQDGKWGFIDGRGKIRIKLQYDGARSFSEGKAAVRRRTADGENPQEWAYIDKRNTIVIDYFKYSAVKGLMIRADEFREGLAFVSKDFYTVIDSEGNDLFTHNSKFFISACIYDSRYDVIPGYVFVDEKMTVRKYGFLGLDGRQRLEPVFDYIYAPQGEFVIVEKKVDGEYKTGLIRLIEKKSP